MPVVKFDNFNIIYSSSLLKIDIKYYIMYLYVILFKYLLENIKDVLKYEVPTYYIIKSKTRYNIYKINTSPNKLFFSIVIFILIC